jgi:hypothetical protein
VPIINGSSRSSGRSSLPPRNTTALPWLSYVCSSRSPLRVASSSTCPVLVAHDLSASLLFCAGACPGTARPRWKRVMRHVWLPGFGRSTLAADGTQAVMASSRRGQSRVVAGSWRSRPDRARHWPAMLPRSRCRGWLPAERRARLHIRSARRAVVDRGMPALWPRGGRCLGRLTIGDYVGVIMTCAIARLAFGAGQGRFALWFASHQRAPLYSVT